MAGPVEVKPFEAKVRAERLDGRQWVLRYSAGTRVALIEADADQVEEIVRLINDSFGTRVAEYFDAAQPLTMEFEAGELVKVYGARPEYMDGSALIRLVKRLAKLNLEQEVEISRYAAEAAEAEAETKVEHAFPQAASYKDRSITHGGLTKREWFAGQVVAGGHITSTSAQGLARGVVIATDCLILELAKDRG